MFMAVCIGLERPQNQIFDQIRLKLHKVVVLLETVSEAV